MDLQASLSAFVGFALYPAWLLCGATDYWCHRRSAIEHSSGAAESWLHLQEYLCMAVIVGLALRWRLSGWVLLLAGAAAVVHTALSYMDVRHTVDRRFISALEQHVRAVLIVAPPVAVSLLGLMEHGAAAAAPRSLAPWQLMAVLATMAISGLLILEELQRSRRSAG